MINYTLVTFCRNKPELENPYMFSNIEVENTGIEVLESRDIISPRQVENVNRMDIIPLNTRISENSTNQSNNSNFVGKGIITVCIQLLLLLFLNMLCIFIFIIIT